MSVLGQFQFRSDAAAAWEEFNPVLLKAEMGIEEDTRLFKIGDGETPWVDLAYGGMQGIQGEKGDTGTGVQSVEIIDGNLVVTFDNGEVTQLSRVEGRDGEDGTDGQDGADGVGVKGAYVNTVGHLIVELTNGERKDAGLVVGKDGEAKDGKDGTSVANAEIRKDSHLWITLTDGTEIDAGVARFSKNYFSAGGGKKGEPQLLNYRTVPQLAQRDAIPPTERLDGLLVYVEQNRTTYQLNGGILNGDWVPFPNTGNATIRREEFILGQRQMILTDITGAPIVQSYVKRRTLSALKPVEVPGVSEMGLTEFGSDTFGTTTHTAQEPVIPSAAQDAVFGGTVFGGTALGETEDQGVLTLIEASLSWSYYPDQTTLVVDLPETAEGVVVITY